jgi:hypothetical protein
MTILDLGPYLGIAQMYPENPVTNFDCIRIGQE